MASFKDFAKKALRAGLAWHTGGISETVKYAADAIKADGETSEAGLEFANLAASDRDAQRASQMAAMDSQKRRFDAESNFLEQERERYDSTYKPIEQGIADKLADGPALEEQAAIAGSDFANEFDTSVQAREREMMRAGVSHRPGSSAQRMQGENDAYNRARGVAGAKTQARREADDEHFLRSTAFYNANGNSIRNRLQQGLQTMYGADYTAHSNQAINYGNDAAVSQQLSSAVNSEANSGKNALLGIAGQVGGAIIGGITGGPVGVGVGSQIGSTITNAMGAKTAAGAQGNGVTTYAAPRQQAIKQTNYAGTYRNDGMTNQNRAAGAGAVQSEINAGYGRGS